MAKNNDIGIFQLSNGNWAYRIYTKRNGKNADTTCRRDNEGNAFLTKRAAKTARENKIVELRNTHPIAENVEDTTIQWLWDYYLEHDSKVRAHSTVVKYKSLWKNHVRVRFAKRTISDITIADINDFLIDLYNKDLAYSYIESFLKMFYMFYGIAYRTEHITTERYTRMFLDKGTKLRMPSCIHREEDDPETEDGVRVFEQWEISEISNIFKRGNCYTAFMLGYYLGVRISECFALTWSDINWSTRQITINKQLNYEDGCFCLNKVKTLTSKRTIDIPPILHSYLLEQSRIYYKKKDKQSYRNNELVLNKLNPKNIKEVWGGDFINRKDNGELLTINSIKYWATQIKAAGIDFKYHSLRKTHITQLVSMNTPAVEVMQRVGHKKFDTTLKYYINANMLTREKTLENLQYLNTEEPIIERTMCDGTTKALSQREWIALDKASSTIPH